MKKKLLISPCQITSTKLLHVYTIHLQQNNNTPLILIMLLFTTRDFNFSSQPQPTKINSCSTETLLIVMWFFNYYDQAIGNTIQQLTVPLPPIFKPAHGRKSNYGSINLLTMQPLTLMLKFDIRLDPAQDVPFFYTPSH